MNLEKFKNSVLSQQCKKIREQILNYQKYIDPIGRLVSNMGGWQSRFNFEFPFYDDWTKYFFESCGMYYSDYVAKFYKKLTWQYDQKWKTDVWFNINWSGDYNKEHSHVPPDIPNEFFYLPPEIEDDRDFWLPYASGCFYVTDSHNTFFVSKDSERKYIDFNAGDFWIGNPNLDHGVNVNKQNDPRISISFNIEPIVDRELK